MAPSPLAGVTVLDLSRVLAGPMAGMLLGDLGADVIKVEHPTRGDDTRDWGVPVGQGQTSYFLSFNRNKRSIAVDISSEEGRRDILALCRQADIVIENFKTGGMERLGLGYELLKQVNPKLIYCSISGYGRSGSEANRPGYDLVIQGESGLMGLNGEQGGPSLKFGIAAVDLFTGMAATQAILAALYERSQNGVARRVDLALYDCGVMITSYCGMEALLNGVEPPRYGNAHPSIVPYGVFDAADGPVVITAGNNRQFVSLCQDVLGRPDIASDSRYASNLLRCAHRMELLEQLNSEFSRIPRVMLIERLTQAGIPCGEVLGPLEALQHPRTEEADLVVSMENGAGVPTPIFNPPWRFDGKRPAVRRRPPNLGEHNSEIQNDFLD